MNGYQPEGIFFSTYAAKESFFSLPQLNRIKENKTLLEGQVILCDSQMNLHVAFGNMQGIIPKEEVVYPIGGELVKDIAILTRVGKSVCFHITAISEKDGAPILLLSRKSAQKECYFEKIRKLKPGDIIKARVTHMENFGAFLDIGCGIISLMPIDCISVSRISHPSLRLSIGETIDVVVRSLDENGRVYVSRKELLGTWEENASLFAAGQTVPGIIRSIESYGIFVELTPNLTGLAELKEGVNINESAAVYIKSILPDRMKIKLVILDSYKKNSAAFIKRPNISLPKDHISYWRYSPQGSSKLIETYFE